MSTKPIRVAGRFKNSIIENDRRKLVGDQATFGSPFLLSGIGSGSGSGQVGRWASGRVGSGRDIMRRTAARRRRAIRGNV